MQRRLDRAKADGFPREFAEEGVAIEFPASTAHIKQFVHRGEPGLAGGVDGVDEVELLDEEARLEVGAYAADRLLWAEGFRKVVDSADADAGDDVIGRGFRGDK